MIRHILSRLYDQLDAIELARRVEALHALAADLESTLEQVERERQEHVRGEILAIRRAERAEAERDRAREVVRQAEKLMADRERLVARVRDLEADAQRTTATFLRYQDALQNIVSGGHPYDPEDIARKTLFQNQEEAP